MSNKVPRLRTQHDDGDQSLDHGPPAGTSGALSKEAHIFREVGSSILFLFNHKQTTHSLLKYRPEK